MQYTTAIAHADAIRPNSISTEQKYAWLAEIDGKIGLSAGIRTSNQYPNNAVLVAPFPYDNVYELYLIAMYDIYNQDVSLYQADYALFNEAFSEAKAYIARTVKSKSGATWKVM